MSYQGKLNGIYIITDDQLTPLDTILVQIEKALQGGATIVQLRDKTNSDAMIKSLALEIQELCKKYHSLFLLNDKVDIAIECGFDGLHIGKSDYEQFLDIRKNFKGVLGVSCYGDIQKAKYFQTLGADYVAFGSFFSSPTKPNSEIISLEVLEEAKKQLHIPVCAIGGINHKNVTKVIEKNPDMIAVISDIWNSEDITQKVKSYLIS